LRRGLRRRARRAGLNLLGLLVALITLFPIFWMVSTAFKPATEWYSLTPHPLPAHPTLANFRAVIDGSVIGLPYWNFLKNSLFVTVVSVVASSLIALLAAVALARFRFRFRTTYLIMLPIVQMLPQQALVIALAAAGRHLVSGHVRRVPGQRSGRRRAARAGPVPHWRAAARGRGRVSWGAAEAPGAVTGRGRSTGSC